MADADGDDLVNSSDMEVPERPNKWAHLGTVSIDKMFEDAYRNRMESKIISKQVTQGGAPGTVQSRALWVNRFNAFRRDTLNEPEGSPSAEDLKRFLIAIPQYLNGVGTVYDPSNTKPSFAYVRCGLAHLIDHFVFEYNLQFTKQECAHISETMKDLIERNVVTKDAKRERQWLGAFAITRMVFALFSDALVYGVWSWDIVLQRSLAIVLLAALCARGGDIGRTKLYENSECLLYRHIALKLVQSDGMERLHAQVSLHSEKGKKRVKKDAKVVRLTALMDPQRNTCCPINLLLILALRTGAVASTSIEDLLAQARAHKEKLVVWQYPDRPVLPAYTTSGSGAQLVLDKSASCQQINTSVKIAAELCGIPENVHGHQVRYGSAADLANISGHIKGGSTSLARKGLGHSKATEAIGVTDKYVGEIKEDLWKRKLELLDDAPADPFGVTFTDTSFKRQRSTVGEIDEYCLANGLNPKDPLHRGRASKQLKSDAKRKWSQGVTAAAESAASPKVLLEWPKSRINEQVSSNSTAGSQTIVSRELNDEAFVNIDPALLSYATDEQSREEDAKLCIGPEGLDLDLYDIEALATLAEEGPADVTTDELRPLYLEPMQFVRVFSEINLVKSSVPLSRATNLAKGNARSEPTPFMNTCSNSSFGCPRVFPTTTSMYTHLNTCQFTSVEVAEERKEWIPCTVDGCTKTFSSNKRMKAHVKAFHENGRTWTPKPCEKGCDPSTLYISDSGYRMHIADVHSGFIPQTCQFPGCKSTLRYEKVASLYAHYRTAHKLMGKADQKPYILTAED